MENDRTYQADDWAGQIRSRSDFAALVDALVDDFRRNAGQWENPDLASFLEALAAWVKDMDGYYKNRGEAVPEHPAWDTFARILLAARVYE
jgi:hypothetical protein